MSKGRRIASCPEPAEGCTRDAGFLVTIGSRNAAYLASQAAEHIITAVATSEDIHIERKDAHQLDTIVRKIPVEAPDRAILMSISVLEAYATSCRYGTPTGRLPTPPLKQRNSDALETIDMLIESLRRHFAVSPDTGGLASRTSPRR